MLVVNLLETRQYRHLEVTVMTPRSDYASVSITSAGTPSYVWLVGAASFAVSGVAFLIAVLFLYAAEGPGSLDVPSTLAQPSGQNLFFGLVTAGTIAVLLGVVGMATL